MTAAIRLIAPDVSLHREFLDLASSFDGADIPGSSSNPEHLATLADPEAFRSWVELMLDQEHGRRVPDNRVPCASRWIVRDDEGSTEIIGTINLRMQLDDHLLKVEGGHIGYAVAPHARRQGVATEALRLMMAEAAGLGINPLLITCDDDNAGSARTIENAGGVLEDVRDGTRRYWVTMPDLPMGYAAFPLSERPLFGVHVLLRLMTTAERQAMHAAGPDGRTDPAARLADWAEGFPRQDDLDGASLDDPDRQPDRAWGNRLIVRRSDDQVVGTLGFVGPPDPADPARTVEIGYGLVESARGQGLITDALRLAVPAAEASGATVTAHAAYDNEPSRKALLRAGLRPTDERNDEGETRFVRPRP